MKILLLNQYAPPDLSPTSRLLGELAESLRAHGHEVAILAEAAAYRGHHTRTGSRLMREMNALRRLFLRALFASPRPDIIVAFSSPACLLAVAAIVALLRRCRLAHWAMDLYPDIALALEELKPGLLALVLRRLMRWAYHRASLIVALDDDMAAHLQKHYGVVSRVLAPWPAAAISRNNDEIPTDKTRLLSPGAAAAGEIWTWLYSGNLGRAHEWRPLLLVQAELERRGFMIQLLFEGGGACWNRAAEYAKTLNLAHCKWTGYVSEEQSLTTVRASRVICATQKKEAQGLLWPSKLARIVPMAKPLLWIGPVDGAVARSLGDRPATGCFHPGQVSEIADWLESLYRTGSAEPAVADDRATAQRWRKISEEGGERWNTWLQEIGVGHGQKPIGNR
ncbi:MAG TPA: glycosyltransferase [Chthoniobacterales bacterium]